MSQYTELVSESREVVATVGKDRLSGPDHTLHSSVPSFLKVREMVEILTKEFILMAGTVDVVSMA